MLLRIFSSTLLLCVALVTVANAQLSYQVDATATPGTWTYTLTNNEPAGSPNYLSMFSLSVDAPVTVTSSPTGWAYQSDGKTYVDWFNNDAAPPYPNDVAPGTSLAGFTIESAAGTSAQQLDTVSSWDHVADAPGPSGDGLVLAPSVSTTVPEPSSGIVFGAFGICISLMVARLRRRGA
jgi:hypothetical protein